MANRFWIGDGGSWTDTAHWSTTSGGGGGASVPTGSDDAFFDVNSFTIVGQVVARGAGAPIVVRNLSFSGALHAPTLRSDSSEQIQILGNFVGASGVIVEGGNGTVFQCGAGDAGTTYTLDSQGAIFGGNSLGVGIGFGGSAPKTMTLLSDFVVQDGGAGFSLFFVSASSVSSGTFDAGGFDVTVEQFSAFGNSGNVPTVTMGSGTWTLKPTTNSLPIWSDIAAPNTAIINATGSTLNIDLSVAPSSSAYLFGTFSARTFFTVQIIGNGTTDRTVFFTGENITGDSLAFGAEPTTVKFTAGKVYSFPDFISMNGSSGKLITLLTDSSGTPSTLSTDAFAGSFINVKDNTAAGAATPFDDSTGGVNSGGNTNWFFGSPPVASFDGTPTTGVTSLVVTFTDTSTGSPTSWLWDFGDGQTSTDQNPVHTYTTGGIYTVTLTASNSGGSSMATQINYITVNQNPLFLQTVYMVGADTGGNVQTINTGKNDDGNPIFYELLTQEIEYGNRAHLKKIADEVVVFSQFGEDSNFSASTDSQDEKPIDMDLSERVNFGKDINIEGHFVTFRWFGASADVSPVFEGIYIEKMTDIGMTEP